MIWYKRLIFSSISDVKSTETEWEIRKNCFTLKTCAQNVQNSKKNSPKFSLLFSNETWKLYFYSFENHELNSNQFKLQIRNKQYAITSFYFKIDNDGVWYTAVIKLNSSLMIKQIFASYFLLFFYHIFRFREFAFEKFFFLFYLHFFLRFSQS